MTHLRLIADDLTGALDSAAAFTRALGPQRVVWSGDAAGASVLNIGTREGSPDRARARAAAAASFLMPAPDRVALFKVDSLLRGHAGAELAAMLDKVSFDHIVIAPAFPFQNRTTRHGRQWIESDGGQSPVGEDIAGTLRQAGHTVTLCQPGSPLPRGISLWDAGSMHDLHRIVAAGHGADGPLLWVGAAGLASALAATLTAEAAQPIPLRRPLLGLIGTDHPVMQKQLAAVPHRQVVLGPAPHAAADAITAKLDEAGVAFATVGCPPGLDRLGARSLIAARFRSLLGRTPRPATLFVSGGETLSDVATALGAVALDVIADLEPGVPVSCLVGGAWDGMTVLSRSGAFGSPDFFKRLIGSLSPSLSDGLS